MNTPQDFTARMDAWYENTTRKLDELRVLDSRRASMEEQALEIEISLYQAAIEALENK